MKYNPSIHFTQSQPPPRSTGSNIFKILVSHFNDSTGEHLLFSGLEGSLTGKIGPSSAGEG